MGGDLRNIPNMPDYAVTLEIGGNSCGRDYIHDEVSGILYRAKMYHAIHDACGCRLKALVDRSQYNRSGRDHLVPWLVYCPRCFVRVGKKGRKRLQARGRLIAFQDIRNLSSPRIRKNFVEAYYLYPLGIYLDENGQIGEVSKNQVEIVEEKEKPVVHSRSAGYRRAFRSPCAEQVLGDGGEQDDLEPDLWEDPPEPPEDDF